jgi:hypothetical protein
MGEQWGIWGPSPMRVDPSTRAIAMRVDRQIRAKVL